MTKVTEGEWVISDTRLIRVMQKGTGICIAGIHRNSGHDRSEILANAQLITSSKVTLAALRLAAKHIIDSYGTDGEDDESVGFTGGGVDEHGATLRGEDIDFTFGQVRALQAAIDRTRDIEL